MDRIDQNRQKLTEKDRNRFLFYKTDTNGQQRTETDRNVQKQT